MSTKNGLLRKKLARLVVSIAVVAIMLAVWGLVPAFQTAEYEIRDNQLTVERDNKYNTNMDVAVIIIDERGNVKEEFVKVHFDEGKTSHIYDEEYFKNVLETEDDVHIVSVETELRNLFSNFTPVVNVIAVITFIITMIACFCFMMSLFNLIH